MTLQLQVGGKLKNGAEIMDFMVTPTKRVVMADFGDGHNAKFVTWLLDEEGNAYWGHYFSFEHDAYMDFLRRCDRGTEGKTS